jgi:NADH-quinone oxidoreductase subunit E
VIKNNSRPVSPKQLEKILADFEPTRPNLIPLLQAVQKKCGYLPPASISAISRYTRVPESEIFGIATFYAQFKFTPAGRNLITICRGTACHVRGSAKLLDDVTKKLGIEPGQTTPDFNFSLQTVACFGSCALAPVVVTNGKVEGRMNTGRLFKTLEHLEGNAAKARPGKKKKKR